MLPRVIGWRYADPETYLISREQWTTKRAEACRLIGAPENGAERLENTRSSKQFEPHLF
jgi:hypothetical protein